MALRMVPFRKMKYFYSDVSNKLGNLWQSKITIQAIEFARMGILTKTCILVKMPIAIAHLKSESKCDFLYHVNLRASHVFIFLRFLQQN